MAHIPVENGPRRRPWLKWAIGLFVIAVLIWLLLEALDPDPEGLGPDDTDGIESVEPLPGAE